MLESRVDFRILAKNFRHLTFVQCPRHVGSQEIARGCGVRLRCPLIQGIELDRKFIKYIQNKQLEAISKQEEENREKIYNLKLAEEFEKTCKHKAAQVGIPYSKSRALDPTKANS